MNQQISQGAKTAPPADAPIKRKRGRPRKDETQAHQAGEKATPVVNQPLRPMVTRMMLGEGSTAIQTTPSTPSSKGKDQVEVGIAVEADDDHQNNDQMVGQVVTGVLECAFDAGYFLRVRVGDTNVHMRGVVFKEGCVVPVTPDNDIAPNAKMYKRKDIPIPVTFTPQIPQSGAGDSSSKPIETFDDQQRQPPPIETFPRKEGQSTIPMNMNTEQEKLAVDKEPSQNPEVVPITDQEKITEVVNHSNPAEDKVTVESSAEVISEPASDQKDRKDSDHLELSEPQIKLQQTDETTGVYSNGLPPTDVASGTLNSDEGARDSAVKADEAVVAVVIEKTTIPPESAPFVKDPDGVEPEIGDASNFQISMENTDNDEPDPLPEPPNEVSHMQTE